MQSPNIYQKWSKKVIFQGLYFVSSEGAGDHNFSHFNTYYRIGQYVSLSEIQRQTQIQSVIGLFAQTYVIELYSLTLNSLDFEQTNPLPLLCLDGQNKQLL